MTDEFSYELLDSPEELSGYQGWGEGVYRDLIAFRDGDLTAQALRDKYTRRCAILSMDMTGFTASAISIGELESFVRILDAQRVCIPVLRSFNAEFIRCFADNIVAIFAAADTALDAAFEMHRRMEHFSDSNLASAYPTQCCVGIGYGDVLAIGPDLAQGDEMNRAAKLGEDIARGQETLVTANVFRALEHRDEVEFEEQHEDDLLFPFYRASLRD